LEAGVSVDVLEGGAVGASLQLGRAVWMGIEKVLNAFDPLDAVARSYGGVEGLKVDALEVHYVGDGALAVWSIVYIHKRVVSEAQLTCERRQRGETADRGEGGATTSRRVRRGGAG